MKINATLTLLAISALSLAADKPNPTVYLHGFRSPSIGAEYRMGQFGAHAGFYTTIFNGDDGKSTNFWKAGVTAYLGGGATKRQEAFLSLAYVRGINREFKDKDGAFVEFGNRFALGKGFEARLGTGVLFAKGFKARLNPTIGISYRF